MSATTRPIRYTTLSTARLSRPSMKATSCCWLRASTTWSTLRRKPATKSTSTASNPSPTLPGTWATTSPEPVSNSPPRWIVSKVTANAIATSISTRALSPRAAVGLSAVFNLIGAVITVAFFQAKVSNTIASTLAIKPGLVVVMAALLGAIAWNLITWYRGLPSSSTHALIGGLCGAGIAAAGGLGGVKWSALVKQIASLVISPPLGFLAAGIFAVLLTVVVYRAGWRPGPVNRTLRAVQVVTSAYLSFSHGANDAQKT